MKRNKGFTLIELMIAIGIIAVLITMTVGVLYNSSKKSKERLLSTKIQAIEVSAEKWANAVSLKETLTICVDRLIKDGYLDEENEDGEVINPVDNSTLNGYAVLIDIKNGNYYATFQEGNNCDTNTEKLKRLYDLILAQGKDKTTIEAKGNPDFSIVPTAETSGLYATEDEYGKSYYYRGEKDALANNVIFAEYQWKVVRINGDKSVRLIYNGVCPNNSCKVNSSATTMASVAWNTYSNDAKYVGYMYGGSNGEASISKAQAQTNETDSSIKIELDRWYENNIKNTKYEQYIVDNIFCNDRSITSGPGYGNQVIPTYYNSSTRLIKANPTPTLKCEQKNDRFTVNDTVLGNGALTYPIGLITADEVQYAGTGALSPNYNSRQYLASSMVYWTLSPSFFNDTDATMLRVSMGNFLLNAILNYPFPLRGTLNLSSDVFVLSGDGTASNPYIISS